MVIGILLTWFLVLQHIKKGVRARIRLQTCSHFLSCEHNESHAKPRRPQAINSKLIETQLERLSHLSLPDKAR